MSSSGPLAGVRVLDLSWLLPGPFFTGMLADLGADVLKVERPGDGDYARALLPGMFSLVNRGKRSAVVDLRSDEGCDTVLSLACKADIFVEGFRPGVVARLGVSYEAVRAINPRIVYVSLTGYGQATSAANEPGHDVNYCGRAGLLGIPASADQEGAPPRMQLPVSDLAGAMYAAVATLAALRDRDHSGEGQWLDISLAQSALAWSAVRWADAPITGQQSWRHVNPANDVFLSSDGQRVAAALVEPHFWQAFEEVLSPEQSARIRNAGSDLRLRMQVLRDVFGARTAAQWMDFAASHDVPISLVAASFDDVLADPFFSERNAWIESDQGERSPAFPVEVRGMARRSQAPQMGEATPALATLWGDSA